MAEVVPNEEVTSSLSSLIVLKISFILSLGSSGLNFSSERVFLLENQDSTSDILSFSIITVVL